MQGEQGEDYGAQQLLGEAVDEACWPVTVEAWEQVRPLIAALYSDEALNAYPRPDVAALIRRLRAEPRGPA